MAVSWAGLVLMLKDRNKEVAAWGKGSRGDGKGDACLPGWLLF